MIWYLPYAPDVGFRAVYLPPDSIRPMAALNLDRPGGDLAAKTAEPDAVRTRIVASATTKTALRRPDRTRNVAPPYRIDAVSASNGGSVGPEQWTGLGARRLGTPAATQIVQAGTVWAPAPPEVAHHRAAGWSGQGVVGTVRH